MKMTEFFQRNIDDVVTQKELDQRLKSGKKLRIKYGVDVTAPDLHIGHAVNLWMMRELQDQGHKVIFLIGDFTTQIGDPTGKNRLRPIIPASEIKQNTKEFIKQAQMVLRFDKPSLLEIRHNSEWFDKMPTAEFVRLLTMITHARLIERDMFQDRLKNHDNIYMHELIYPILQGWDSVELKSDLTIIGSDQLFNESLGRFYQQQVRQAPQVIITTKITPGIDGKNKQSKSLGNYIGLGHSPAEKYGRLMSIPDELIVAYLRCYTEMPNTQIAQIEQDLAAGDNPRDSKASLARHVITRYHGETAAQEAEAAWNAQFRDRLTPTDITQIAMSKRRPKILFEIMTEHFALSKSEARRLLEQNGVRVDGEVVTDAGFDGFVDGSVVQIGKRRFVKINLK